MPRRPFRSPLFGPSETVVSVGPKDPLPALEPVRDVVVTTNRSDDTAPPCWRCGGTRWALIEVEPRWALSEGAPPVRSLRCEGCGWLRRARDKYVLKEP